MKMQQDNEKKTKINKKLMKHKQIKPELKPEQLVKTKKRKKKKSIVKKRE